jgi:hypothetical protein
MSDAGILNIVSLDRRFFYVSGQGRPIKGLVLLLLLLMCLSFASAVMISSMLFLLQVLLLRGYGSGCFYAS